MFEFVFFGAIIAGIGVATLTFVGVLKNVVRVFVDEGDK